MKCSLLWFGGSGSSRRVWIGHIITIDRPYNSPLSLPVWFLYTSITCVTFKALNDYDRYQIWERCRDLRDQYRRWILGGMEKAVVETASKRSLAIDVYILDWTASALGNDDSPEKFFGAITGFFNSKLVNDVRESALNDLMKGLPEVLRGLVSRTFSSNSVTRS